MTAASKQPAPAHVVATLVALALLAPTRCTLGCVQYLGGPQLFQQAGSAPFRLRDGGVVELNATALGTFFGEGIIQALQQPLVNGSTYRFEFAASSSVAGQLGYKIGDSDPPNKSHLEGYVYTKPTLQTFSLLYTHRSAGTALSVMFPMGYAAATYRLQNVTLSDCAIPACPDLMADRTEPGAAALSWLCSPSSTCLVTAGTLRILQPAGTPSWVWMPIAAAEGGQYNLTFTFAGDDAQTLVPSVHVFDNFQQQSQTPGPPRLLPAASNRYVIGPVTFGTTGAYQWYAMNLTFTPDATPVDRTLTLTGLSFRQSCLANVNYVVRELPLLQDTPFQLVFAAANLRPKAYELTLVDVSAADSAWSCDTAQAGALFTGQFTVTAGTAEVVVDVPGLRACGRVGVCGTLATLTGGYRLSRADDSDGWDTFAVAAVDDAAAAAATATALGAVALAVAPISAGSVMDAQLLSLLGDLSCAASPARSSARGLQWLLRPFSGVPFTASPELNNVIGAALTLVGLTAAHAVAVAVAARGAVDDGGPALFSAFWRAAHRLWFPRFELVLLLFFYQGIALGSMKAALLHLPLAPSTAGPVGVALFLALPVGAIVAIALFLWRLHRRTGALEGSDGAEPTGPPNLVEFVSYVGEEATADDEAGGLDSAHSEQHLTAAADDPAAKPLPAVSGGAAAPEWRGLFPTHYWRGWQACDATRLAAPLFCDYRRGRTWFVVAALLRYLAIAAVSAMLSVDCTARLGSCWACWPRSS